MGDICRPAHARYMFVILRMPPIPSPRTPDLILMRFRIIPGQYRSHAFLSQSYSIARWEAHCLAPLVAACLATILAAAPRGRCHHGLRCCCRTSREGGRAAPSGAGCCDYACLPRWQPWPLCPQLSLGAGLCMSQSASAMPPARPTRRGACDVDCERILFESCIVVSFYGLLQGF